MTEKRFWFVIDKGKLDYVQDNVSKEKITVSELEDLLNEQQATISQLEEENKKLIEDWEFSFRTEMAHHRFAEKELQEKIRAKQATIEEYEDFCLNLCKFVIGKGLVDEYREEYGKEYKIITKWKGCGSDE